MQLYELPGQIQPEPCALDLLVRRPDLPELLEDRLLILRRNADPGVAHRHLDGAAPFSLLKEGVPRSSPERLTTPFAMLPRIRYCEALEGGAHGARGTSSTPSNGPSISRTR